MSSINFVDYVTPIPASWLNDVNNITYTTVPGLVSGTIPVPFATNSTNAVNATTVTNGVYTVGNQTIGGVKTFSSSPIVPTPTNASDAATKAYADSVVSGYQRIQTYTAQATTSGTSIDFTGIPSWAKKISIMFSGVSTNGTSAVAVQIGSGTLLTSGYLGSSGYVGTAQVAGNMTNAFTTETASGAAVVRHGISHLVLLNSNTWTFNSIHGRSDSAYMHLAGGAATLSSTLDRIRITTVNGTDLFDAGSVNIIVEG